MTELEAQLLQIIEEQQTQLLAQQQSLEIMQTKIIQALSAQSKAIKTEQNNSEHVQKSLLEIQKQFHEVQQTTTQYTKQIEGKIQRMEQVTTANEQALVEISTTQHSVSSQVAKAQQNLLETSEILKRISSR